MRAEPSTARFSGPVIISEVHLDDSCCGLHGSLADTAELFPSFNRIEKFVEDSILFFLLRLVIHHEFRVVTDAKAR